MVEALNIRSVADGQAVLRPAERRATTASAGAARTDTGDAAVFSPEAARAAETARLRELAEEPESELRAAELEAVRSRLRDGAYRVQEVVLQVAVRVAPVIDA